MTLRKRKKSSSTSSENMDKVEESLVEKPKPIETPETETFHIARNLLVRSISAIYFIAFLVAHNQNKYLIGSKGLLPGHAFLKRIRDPSIPNIYNQFLQVPCLFWFTDYKHGASFDFYLNCFQITGLLISIFIALTGKANGFLFTVLWLLYHSIVTVGQNWYSFGWESQTLETGFLAIFLVPFFSIDLKKYPPSRLVMFLFRWLIFRIMIGAGMIKIRGDQCWRDLTCMFWFHETQPIPNPASWWLHQNSPRIFLIGETLANHFVELVVPWLMLVPFRKCIQFAGVCQILFMFGIMISGNLAFLNVLTMVPSIACLDDSFFRKNYKSLSTAQSRYWKYLYSNAHVGITQRAKDLLLLTLIAFLSYPVVVNLTSSTQVMNTSYDRFKIVGTYGAFGSITKERYEIILEGTTAKVLDGTEKWEVYEFKCKPGALDRRPCQIAPYHYRLDWLMWFAAFQNQSWRHHVWFLNLCIKALKNDKELLDGLLESYPNGEIKHIRAKRYLYNFGYKKWYMRQDVDENWYMPPVSLEGLEKDLKKYPMFNSWW